MKNIDIKYKTSKDYKALHKLLKDGEILIGFVAINIYGVVNAEYSKVTIMSYDDKYKSFDIGFTLFEQDFSVDSFVRICEIENIRYIPR